MADALSIGSDFVEFQFSTQHPHNPVPISTITISTFSYSKSYFHS